MDCTLAGSDGRAPVFRPGQMYRRILLSVIWEGVRSAVFSVSYQDYVFFPLLCEENRKA